MAEVKKNKLKTSVHIYNRLLWDESLGLDKSRIEIVHHDKNQRLKSVAFTDWKSIDQGGDIPFHRIAQFKYNNMILWDRQQRIDNINKNSGETTLNIHTIQQSIHHIHDNHNNDNNDNQDDDDNDNNDNNDNQQTQNNDTNNNNYNDINNYKDPMNTSEYIADSQFLSLLKMGPKNVSLLYSTLNEMIDNAFITQRPNKIESLSRKLCYKYLSYINTMKQYKYCLFGSGKIALDSHESDLDVKITSFKDTDINITTRTQCIQLLNTIKNEFVQLKTLQYGFKQNDKNTNDTDYINITIDDFKNDTDYDETVQLQCKINNDTTSIDEIMVKLSSIHIADTAVIPRGVVVLDIKIKSTNSIIMNFTVSMDIAVSFDITGHESMREKHLEHWMEKHCINNKDKRIHKYLFSVKLWAQHFKINSSIMSTINGYGWIHIALFLLTQNYKQSIQNMQISDDKRDDNKEYESMYPDIDIPTDINCGTLFILFIDMIHSWICYDEIKEENPEKIVRSGMNIITGEWIKNTKEYTLFVLDPFDQNDNLPGNLAKCVRDRKGIPLLINAIKCSVQQLQFAADEAIKQNKDMICKHIEFLNNKQRSINTDIKDKNDDNNDNETKQDDDIDDDDTDDDDVDISQYYSWKQLCSFNLNLPKRRWIQQGVKSKDDIITICQFNCLAQALCIGDTERTTFRTDKKYLKWNYRSKRILYEILQYKPDIICLCEVDKIHFHSFYYPNLSKSAFKYDGIYLNKNNPNKTTTKRTPKDGVCIFWNSTKFSCSNKYECVLGKPTKAYHVALGLRLKYKTKYKVSKEFDVWATHLKAGRNNKAENWRVSQVNTLLYYMRKYSSNVPILFCGDLNAHFEAIINDKGDLVESKVYPAFINGEVKSSKYKNNNNKNNDKDRDSYVVKFESVWNNETRNTFSTWAGWNDRDVKCCLDYIMIGHWNKVSMDNKKKKEKMFQIEQILDVWEEKQIGKFDCKLPNKIYPSDHILIATKIAIKTD